MILASGTVAALGGSAQESLYPVRSRVWTQTPADSGGVEAAKAAAEQELAVKADRNRNKISDELEALLDPAAPDSRFDVIVTLAHAASDGARAALKSRYGDFTEKFIYPSINAFATTLAKAQISALAASAGVELVEFDAPVYPHLDAAQAWFGTQKARTDFGVDGNADGLAAYSQNDIVIAVLDTGIDPNHVDLDGGKIIGWKDINNNQPNPYDELGDCGGHGTHVASIAAGAGDGNAAYIGVAPGAALVGVKVLSLRLVQGTLRCTAATSEIVAGVQWVIDNKDAYGIRVGNMSLGAAGCANGTNSLSSIVNAASDAGMVMTVSAGNEGPGPCTVGSPAAAEKAVTVGAMADVRPGSSVSNACGDNDLPDAGFYLACFSSRGPTADGRMKPDIASPGVFITAARAGTASGYITYSGTSMSSPFTAGVAALMLHANPALTPVQVKQQLESTALDWGQAGKDADYGSGRLRGYEAVKSAGAFSGTGPSVPAHSFTQNSLSAQNTEDFWDITVSDASVPLAVTLVMPEWERFNKPDFDMELRNPSGSVIAASLSSTRQETIGIQPAAAGTYQLRVYVYRGSGPYFFDVSFGEAAVAISLTTDGTTPFGLRALGETVDTTPSGTGDLQAVRVTSGPANLAVRSTAFAAGGSVWPLDAAAGTDRVRWEFSPDASTWNTFLAADTLYTLAANVAEGGTQNLYLRLTMPAETSAAAEHSAVVTVVATAP